MFLQENSEAARHKDTISPSRPPSIAAVAATSSRYGKWKRALMLENDMDLHFIACFQKGRRDIRHRRYRTLHMPFKVFIVKKKLSYRDVLPQPSVENGCLIYSSNN